MECYSCWYFVNSRITSITLFASCLYAGTGAEAAEKQNLPDINFILADDMGCSQLGCYGGNYYETPHINRLASEGILFTNTYLTAAVCSLTRVSIVTDKYPARLKISDFIAGNNRSDYLLSQPGWQKFLPLGETIWEKMKGNK